MEPGDPLPFPLRAPSIFSLRVAVRLHKRLCLALVSTDRMLARYRVVEIGVRNGGAGQAD